MSDLRINTRKDPRLQTSEEWVRDYERVNPDPQAEFQPQLASYTGNSIVQLHPGNNQPTDTAEFKFLDFRTFRTSTYSSVALEFERIDGAYRATAFFGVKLKNNHGTEYRPKVGGQFIPPKHGKFIKFWMEVVGQKPARWCRVHKSMYSKLRDKFFTGDISSAIDRKDKPYFKLTNLRPLKRTQIGHL